MKIHTILFAWGCSQTDKQTDIRMRVYLCGIWLVSWGKFCELASRTKRTCELMKIHQIKSWIVLCTCELMKIHKIKSWFVLCTWWVDTVRSELMQSVVYEFICPHFRSCFEMQNCSSGNMYSSVFFTYSNDIL